MLRPAISCLFVPLLMIATGAFAQDEQEGTASEIIVIAPRPVTSEVRAKGPDGRVSAVISLKMVVQYGDLDLREPQNADFLLTRIRSVARDACKYLDRLYPLIPDPDCRERAFQDAMPQARAAIAAAGG